MEQIIKETIDYIVNFIEKPHPVFGNIPVCPFSKPSRLKGKIKFIVMPFKVSKELDPLVLMLAELFAAQHRYDSFFVINPDKSLNLDSVVDFCNRLQCHILSMGLVVFRGHPKDNFKVGDLYVRREPYPGFQLLKKSLILESRSKLTSNYFMNWSKQSLTEIGVD